MTTNNFLYIDRMDWGAGHLTTTERTRGGGAFANKKLPAGPGIWKKKFKCPGFAPGGEARGWKVSNKYIHVQVSILINYPRSSIAIFWHSKSKYIAIGESLFTYFASLAYVSLVSYWEIQWSAVNNDRVLKDKFCQKIWVQYIKCILHNACLKNSNFYSKCMAH